MEKKTIGTFISALRRAAGMTQRELGEHLYVSDKTVSRWERDECTPDLALIPVIADLFGITADELLRGERNGTSPASDTESMASEPTPYQKAKSERQFSALLKRRMVQYRNRSMISVGIALFGVIAAAIINLGFLRAQIAFWTASCFLVAALICQHCFYTLSHFELDDEQEPSEAQIKATHAFNKLCIVIAQRVRLLVVCLLAFCLPLGVLDIGTYRGLTFDSWLLWGAGFAAVALIVGYSVWELIGRRQLVRRGTLMMDERETACYAAERRLLGRSLRILIVAGVLTLVATAVVQSLDVSRFSVHYVFDTKEEFIAFAEAEPSDEELVYHGWFTDVYEAPVSAAPSEDVVIEFEDGAGEEVLPPEDEDDEYLNVTFYGRDGEPIFTYIDRRRTISHIKLSDSEDGFPIKVYTNAQIRAGYAAKQNVADAIVFIYGVFGGVVVAVYIKKLLDIRKKYQV